MDRKIFNIPILTNSPQFSRLMWGVVILLVVAAFIIPRVDMSIQHDSPRAQAVPDPFDDAVVAIEEELEANRLDTQDRDQAYRLAPLLKSRALTNAGPMTPSEMIWVVEHLQEYRPQIASQPSEAARETLRRHRNDLLFEELPRLDPERGSKALNEIRRAYLEALEIDPAQ